MVDGIRARFLAALGMTPGISLREGESMGRVEPESRRGVLP